MDELLAFRARHKNIKRDSEKKDKVLTQRPRKPYINQYNELVIPFDGDPRYHYWNGGKAIEETLKELEVTTETSKYYH